MEDLSKIAQPAKGGDHYDTWCETGTICKRKISSYIYDVKGNGAYGNEKGAIGSYDVIVRTNLNGRQATWTVTRIWDSGPSLKFTSSYQRCWEQRAALSPRSCGAHSLTGVTLSSGTYRNVKKIKGNYLKNSNNYKGIFSTKFTPKGYSTYTASNLDTGTFNCYRTSSDICYFP
ncbi:hypothetical protein BJH93_10855 [Kocuria polaris]|nr:hypothetical protein [Kocuria polaris]